MSTTTHGTKLNAAKDGMLNEGGHAIHDAKTAAQHFKDDARDAAGAVKDDLEDVARRTGHHIRELADSAKHGLTGTGEVMTAKIRNNPVQSSLIALGAGFLVGMFFSRR